MSPLKCSELVGDEPMIGLPGGVEPGLELNRANPPPPQLSARQSARNKAKASADPPAVMSAAGRQGDHRRIEFILGPVAVNGGTRRIGNDASEAERLRAPHQPINQRIFERVVAVASAPAEAHKPIRIHSTGVRHG